MDTPQPETSPQPNSNPSNRGKIIVAVCVLLLCGALYGFMRPQQDQRGNDQTVVPTQAVISSSPTNSNGEMVCNDAGGKWLPEYNECEGVSDQQCTDAGGTFEECGSPCRHNTEPDTVCVQMCVPICKF